MSVRILVKTRMVCEFCVEGRITLDDGQVISCYHCDEVGYLESWADLRALVHGLHVEDHFTDASGR